MKISMLNEAMRVQTNRNPQNVMNQWLEAVEEFHAAFRKLAKLSTQFVMVSRSPKYAGQCPEAYVFQLMASMQRELIHLVDDVDQSSNLTNLASHTVLLNALAAQATLAVQLANYSAC